MSSYSSRFHQDSRRRRPRSIAVLAATSFGDLIAQIAGGQGRSSRSSRVSPTSCSPRRSAPAARYADIRFTHELNVAGRHGQLHAPAGAAVRAAAADPAVVAAVAAAVAAAAADVAAAAACGVPTDADRQAAGFGVRVDPQRRVGLRQQPDRHRRRDPAHHARWPTEVAKASAIAKKVDVKLAPVPAYIEITGSRR